MTQTVKQTAAPVTRTAAKTVQQVTSTTSQTVQTVVAAAPTVVSVSVRVPAVPTVAAPVTAAVVAPVVPQAEAVVSAPSVAPVVEHEAAALSPIVAQTPRVVHEAEAAPQVVATPPEETLHSLEAVPINAAILDVHDHEQTDLEAVAAWPSITSDVKPLHVHDVPPPALSGEPVPPVQNANQGPLDDPTSPRPASQAAVPATMGAPSVATVSPVAPSNSALAFEDLWEGMMRSGRRLASVIVLPNLAPPG